MSLADLQRAVDALPPDDLAKLASYVVDRDKLAWDAQLECDFSPGGKHAATLHALDAEIDAGTAGPLP